MEAAKPDVSKRDAIYVRVSSHDQKQGGDLERQNQSLLEYAKLRGYEVVVMLEDVTSGSMGKGIPNEIFSTVKEGEIVRSLQLQGYAR